MAPRLHFLGGKFEIQTDKETITVSTEKVFRLPDLVLAYITEHVDLRKIKDYACDVLVLKAHKQDEELISKIQPKLVILRNYKEPMYAARELQKKTGVQTIAATEGLTLDLSDYSALAEQNNKKSNSTADCQERHCRIETIFLAHQ